jgi:hypothetical protein
VVLIRSPRAIACITAETSAGPAGTCAWPAGVVGTEAGGIPEIRGPPAGLPAPEEVAGTLPAGESAADIAAPVPARSGLTGWVGADCRAGAGTTGLAAGPEAGPAPDRSDPDEYEDTARLPAPEVSAPDKAPAAPDPAGTVSAAGAEPGAGAATRAEPDAVSAAGAEPGAVTAAAMPGFSGWTASRTAERRRR